LIMKLTTIERNTPRCGKYHLSYVSLHDICHCLGCFHQNESDSVMTPSCRHGYSVENRFEAVSENDKKLLQEMYGKPTEGYPRGKAPKSVEVRTVFNSEKAKVMIRKIVKISKGENVKIVFTLKPKHFTETSAGKISEDAFE